ncbi:cytochrome P450 [Actinomadura rugatobispora]|uniref:Cytochrome P450 n=1 Tax=Actinomadura rugatobispora TaxID=1994 RepID=A0ABW0ZZV5_9ACTN
MNGPSAPPAPFPFHRANAFDPAPEFAAFREGPPCRVSLPDGTEHWLVSRHADVREALAHPGLSADDQHPAFPRMFPLPPVPGALSFLRMDDPDHGRLRRALAAEFTVRRTNRLRPGITETVDALLDTMAAASPPADLVEHFALPLPSLVICGLLGVPYADREFFQSRSVASLSLTLSDEETGAAFGELAGYLDRLVSDKEHEPTDDLLGRTVARVADGALGHDELVSIARLLLVAGHETTASMIGLGTLALLNRPDQLALLRDDPGLIPQAVEELLRYLTVVQRGTARVTTEPVRLGGVAIPAGEGVIIALPAANRDPDRYSDPDALNLTRSAQHHVAFGFGMHQCIGQTLARVEMEIAFTRLLDRFPNLSLACDPAELRFRESIIYGVQRLPVAW